MESGRYPLCRACNKKKEAGEIIKCPKCQKWHYASAVCETEKADEAEKESKEESFLYALKSSLVTKSENEYLSCIKKMLPEGYLIQPQANLASFIVRTDNARFQNELYRNVDFIVTDLSYRPLFIIEINDQSHLTNERRERDKKVSHICEEAGIPIIKLWTSYGVNPEYVQKRIAETIDMLPVKRVHHFESKKESGQVTEPEVLTPTEQAPASKKKGCYVATCVYGSYDCPEVWTLRRYRDERLEKTWHGRIFIKVYYFLSPGLVKCFGANEVFRSIWKHLLDSWVLKLRLNGFSDKPYMD